MWAVKSVIEDVSLGGIRYIEQMMGMCHLPSIEYPLLLIPLLNILITIYVLVHILCYTKYINTNS